LVALVSLSAAALTFYIFVAYRVIFHSDAAMKTLLAEEMIRTHRLFPPDWYYVNDIPIIFHHILIAPLLLIFGHSYLIQSVACFVFAILLAGSVYLLFKFSGSSRCEFLVVTAVMFSGVSIAFAGDMFGESAYGPGVATAVTIVALIFRTARAYAERDSRDLRIWSALLVALITVALAGGVRGIFVHVAPSLVALALFVATADRRDEAGPFPRKAAIYVACLVLLATVFGIAAFLGLKTGVRLRDDSSVPRFIQYAQIGHKADLLIQGFLAYSDALPSPAQRPVSLYGSVTAYRLFWFGAVFCLPFVLLRRYRAIRSPYLRFLIPYYVFGFIATLYLCLFTSLVITAGSFRYFCVSTVFAILIVGFAAGELRDRFGWAAPIWIGLTFLPICISSYQEIFALYFDTSDSGGRTGLHANIRQPLVDYLVNKGLRYGYASYWNAGVLTVLSDGQIHVNAVEFGDNPPVRPFRWLGPAHAYEPGAFQGNTFILMNPDECPTINRAVLDGYLGPPESVATVAGYCIMSYGFNVSGRFLGWEERPPSVAADEPYSPGDRKAEMAALVDEITMSDGKPAALKLRVTNRGSRVFVSNGRFPFYLGAHLYSSYQLLKDFNYVLTALPGTIRAGETREIVLPLPAVPDPGKYVVQVSLVQGGVAWFGSMADGQPLRVKLSVGERPPPVLEVRR
jgi:hypothetical protein